MTNDHFDLNAVINYVLSASSPEELVQRFNESGRSYPKNILDIHAPLFPHIKKALEAINANKPPRATFTHDAPTECNHARIGDMVRENRNSRRVGFVVGFYNENHGITFPYAINWFGGRSNRACDTHENFEVISAVSA